MFIKTILSIFEKKKEEIIPPKPEEKIIRDIDIELTYIGNFLMLDIKEDCDIFEYTKALEKKNIKLEDTRITNNALFDGGLEHIKRKKIYFFKNNNIEYNIYSNDEKIFINERITNPENNHIDERILEVKRKTGDYKITNLKHDEIRSTYCVKFFSSDKPDYKFFQLGRENAFNIAQDVLNNLSKISAIKTIINLDIFYETIGITKKEIKKRAIRPIEFTEDKTEKTKSKNA